MRKRENDMLVIPDRHELENRQHNALLNGASNPTCEATRATYLSFKQASYLTYVK